MAEGKPGDLGEREPLADPSETHGICWRHRLDSLAAVLKEGLPDAEPSIGFLIVVARTRQDLFEEVSEQWLSVPHVRVVLDRRHGERRAHRADVHGDRRRADRRTAPVVFDDGRHQPVMVLPIKRAAVAVEEPVGAGRGEAPVAETAPPRERFREWIVASRAITQGTVPSMLAERDRWSARAAEAESQLSQARGDLEDLALTLAGLHGRNDRLTRQQTEAAQALAAALRHMKRAMDLTNLAQGE
ncbi:MAG: hypothetical protein HY294_10120 [Candidatus Rokubacteria bacterium]|nr:hypothetical protein [Candidatus Rokubacteria bacterium]